MAELLLTSNGISNPELGKILLDMIFESPSNTSIAIITNGKSDIFDRRAKFDYHRQNLIRFGFVDAQSFDISTQPGELLNNYNVILLAGGDCKLLMNELRKYQVDKIIKEFAYKPDKIIIGESAGAIVSGPDLALVDFIESCSRYSNSQRFTPSLELYDFYVLPHANRYQYKLISFKENLKRFENERGKSIYQLKDGEAVRVTIRLD